MNAFIAWCAFVGAWALFAGPVYQAALELREQDVEWSALAPLRDADPISPWWWLLPPVRYLLARRRQRKHGEWILGHLTPAQLEGLVRYMNKSAGWLFVSTGGFLLAVTETWALRERYEWPDAVFWGLSVAMALLAVGHAAVRMSRARDLLGKKSGIRDDMPDPAPEG